MHILYRLLPGFLFILTVSESIHAQQMTPLNEQEYNVEVRFYVSYGSIGSDGTGNDPDPTWQIETANDTDSLANDLLNNSPGVDNASYCYSITTANNGWHSVVDALLAVHQNNTTGRFDYEIMSYENDTNPRCIYDADLPGQSQINDDDNMAYLEGIHTFGDETVKGNYKTTIKDLSNGSKVQFRYVWRHSHGLRASPLDFGEVSNCYTFTHSNSTINESGQSAETYYQNDWNSAIHPAFSSSNDVTYIFHNDRRRRIQISSADNFDVKYHLLLTDSGQNVLSIVKTFETSLDTTLMAGYYTLVVEGDEDDGFNTPTGSFEFEMQFSFPDLSSINYSNQIIYVDKTASGNGNGTSWANAMDDLQLALNEATASSQIWVAKGVYYPSDCDDRSHSFDLPHGVEIYGGFAGSEPETFDLSQRNLGLYETILSGDIGVADDSLDNSYHVVSTSSFRPDSYSLTDGFTISKGHADNLRGGGWYITGTTRLIIRHVIFKKNFAFYGGAVGSIPLSTGTVKTQFFNCSFENNRSSSKGGAIYSSLGTGSLDISITDCQFSNNHSNSGGGAIFNEKLNAFGSFKMIVDGSDFTSNSSNIGGAIMNQIYSFEITGLSIENCDFTLNTSDQAGGAIYNVANLGPEESINYSNCNFISNSTNGAGGAIYQGISNDSISHTFLTDCRFVSNFADKGGAVFNNISFGHNIDYVSGCVFHANLADNNGGAILNEVNDSNGKLSQQIISSLFASNTGTNGGAISNIVDEGDCTSSIMNATFYANEATQKGGAIFNENQDGISNSALVNCIFKDNQAGTALRPFYTKDANLAIQYSLLDVLNCDSLKTGEGTNTITCGSGMIFNQSPAFVNSADPDGADNVFGTSDDGLKLQGSSAGINQGTNDSITHISDLIGQKHINMPDIGAYEYPCSDIQAINSVPNITAEYISKAATETLQAANVINPTSNVYYQAGEHILLSPGFEAKSGNVFEARIGDGCL